MSTQPFPEPQSASSPLHRFWIPGIFLLTLAGLGLSGALGRSLTETYLPHGFCFFWNRSLLWTHLLSDGIIALSYLAISTTLTVLVYRSRGMIPFSWIFLSFGAFIVCCGGTHLMEIVTLRYPLYWLSANVKVVTAVASFLTALALPPLVPHILRLLRTAHISEQRRKSLESAQAILRSEVRSQGETLESMAREIAARNRELEESRLQLFITLKSIGDGVITADAAGRVLFMNSAAEDLTGWRSGDAAGRPLNEIFRLLHDATRAPHEDPLTRVRRGTAAPSSQAVLLARDGREIWTEDSIAPIRDTDGQLTGIILTFRDVTERRRAEESRSLLASIVDSSDDAILSRDLAGRITSWNRGAEQLYGYTAEEAIGAGWELLLPEDDPGHRSFAHEVVTEGRRVQHMEVKRRHRSGKLIEVSVTVSPIFDAGGRLIGAATIARDLRQQKLAEEALRTSEKLAATGRLAATIAHEINNPLEAVTNLLYLIELGSRGNAELNEFARKAQEELRRVAYITRQTLAFYRDTTRAMPLDISEVMEGILEIYQREVTGKHLAVHLAVQPGLQVKGFPGELRQVFANLVRNAIEAVPAQGEIWIRGVLDEQQRASITVRDSGPGVPPAAREHIFDPFFTTKGLNGTGLGLWVSQGIVQKHGGNLLLSDTPEGTGAEFVVVLPAEQR